MHGLLQRLPVNRETTCLGNLLTHTVSEIDRYVNSSPKSLYTLASVGRNLFELCLVIHYVLASTDNLVDWMAQRISDEIDVLESARLMSPSAEDTTWIQSNIDKLRAAAAEQEFPSAKYRLPSDYARALGRDQEYRKYYKPISKFTHPSSWVINEDRARLESEDTFWIIFWRLAEKYVKEILSRAADYILTHEAADPPLSSESGSCSPLERPP